jgi:hypothetical protein
MMVVYDDSRRPWLYVTAEINQFARRFGGGSHFLCVFDGDMHRNLSGSDDWADEQKFTKRALEIIKPIFEGSADSRQVRISREIEL